MNAKMCRTGDLCFQKDIALIQSKYKKVFVEKLFFISLILSSTFVYDKIKHEYDTLKLNSTNLLKLIQFYDDFTINHKT